jgi:GT2 family glycosyltransferase
VAAPPDLHAPVAVIIVNWNSGELLARCLASVKAQTLPPREVVVVDNGSTDGSASGVEQIYPGVRVLRLPTNVGFASANNAAAAAVPDAEWIALLNADAFAEPTWLAELMEATRTRPEFSFFASRLVSASAPDRLDGTGDVYYASGWASRRDHGRRAAATGLEVGEVFAPCAAAALYRKDAFVGAGGFDEAYFCYFEDVDLAFRLRLLGHRCLYVPKSVVQHLGSALTGRHSDFTVYHGHRNLVWTYVKNMPSPLFLAYLPQHVLLNLVSFLWFGLRGQGGTILKAKWDALKGLPRVWRQRRALQRARRATAGEIRALIVRGFWRPYVRRGLAGRP